MNRNTLGWWIMIIACAFSVNAQSKIDDGGRLHQTEEELAALKRMGEALRHPTLITIRLFSFTSDGTSEQRIDTPAPFKLGDFINLRSVLSHTFSEPLMIRYPLDPYRDRLPELFRDGELLPYTKKAQAYVERTEKEPANGSAAEFVFLPGREYGDRQVRLENWYEPLGPGHYQITVRRRFAWGGDWLQSASVTFDICQTSPDLAGYFNYY